MKDYTPRVTKEYESFLDLPKTTHLSDLDIYPEPQGLKNTCGWFVVREAAREIYAICEPYHEQNGCFFVILGTDKALVFDTGLGIYDPKPLVEELADGREIIVVNSHFHFDHTGGNHFFDECWLNVDDISRLVANHGLHTDLIKDQVRDEAFPMGVPVGFNQETYGTEPFRYRKVYEGQIFDLGGRTLEVLFTPGHSEDGICLLDKTNDTVLCGDLFYLGALYCQFNSMEFGHSDPVQYRNSLKKLYARISDGTKILCCHNEFRTQGKKIGQAAELFDELLEKLASGDQGAGAESGLSYGEEEPVLEIRGDGFSIMYTRNLSEEIEDMADIDLNNILNQEDTGLDYQLVQNDLAHERTEMAENRTNLAHERTDMAQERTSMAKKRTGMAQIRTDMAFERTELSNSQTLLSYFRTAVAIFAAGIGMFEFITRPVIVQIGIGFMAVSPFILIVGVVHYFIVRKRIKEWKEHNNSR